MSRFAKLIALFQNANTILLGSHYNPDGDAIGSVLALGTALEHLGKKVTIFSRDGVPKNLRFLSGSEQVVSKLDASSKYDLVVIVDCAHLKRVGGDFDRKYPGTPIVVIDHHRLDEHDGEHFMVDHHAAATGVLIAELLEAMKLPLTPELAEHLLTAIVGDTGSFRYSSTSSEVLRLAAKLVDAGAKPWKISQELEESASLQRYRLLASALASLELSPNGQFSAMSITQAMLQSSLASLEDAEEFTVYPRSIAGVEVSALFKEIADGKVRVSLRSKGKLDVAQLAKGFGGGGHAYAAGCTLSMPLPEAKQKIQNAVLEALKGA